MYYYCPEGVIDTFNEGLTIYVLLGFTHVTLATVTIRHLGVPRA